MREAAAARGEIRREGTRAGRRRRRRNGGIRDTRGFSQFHSTGRDPLGLGKVVGRLVAERGWTSPVAVGSVMAEWATLVGPEISAHCTPESFTDTTLHVRCDSTAWATQLRLLSISLLEKFRTELGDGVVTSIQVLGPSAPSWRKGGRTVNGRGPRDTYGSLTAGVAVRRTLENSSKRRVGRSNAREPYRNPETGPRGALQAGPMACAAAHLAPVDGPRNAGFSPFHDRIAADNWAPVKR